MKAGLKTTVCVDPTAVDGRSRLGNGFLPSSSIKSSLLSWTHFHHGFALLLISKKSKDKRENSAISAEYTQIYEKPPEIMVVKGVWCHTGQLYKQGMKT
jgi:hypothetical protein